MMFFDKYYDNLLSMHNDERKQLADSFRYSIGMLLLPEFNSAAAFSFLDPFRVANYICGKKIYDWAFLSLTNQSVTASNEVKVSNVQPFSLCKKKFDLVVINASWAPERFQIKKLKAWLIQNSRQGATLATIDTGAFVLAYAGLLENYRVTVHHEHIAAFKELFPTIIMEEVLYVSDRDRLTCSGGMAVVDMALKIIQNHNGLGLTNAIANYIFKEQYRAGNEQQVRHQSEAVGYTAFQKLREAIVLMERNIEEPLSTAEIAQYLSISQRRLERLFKNNIRVTPVRYYINIRLDRARELITQTDIQIIEIASACGFGTAEHFSRSYSSHFNISPRQDRIDGRIPFQFRSFPSYVGVYA